MAETKTLNTRISLRYDTYSAWTSANPVLLAGEIAVVVIPAETGAVVQEPSILFKVGDGTKDFKTLGFTHSLAADVYSWAKQESKPTYTAAEIEGLGDYISGEIQDTNTTYTLEQDATDGRILILKKKDVGETEWTEVTRITTVDNDTKYDDAIQANSEAIAANAAAIEAVEALVGNTGVAAQISAAIEALDLANTYEAKGAAAEALTEAKAYTDAEVGAVKTAAEGAQAAAEAAQAAADKAQGEVDALETEVAGVKESVTTNAAAIAENKAAIEVLNGAGEGSVTKTVNDAINEFAASVSDDGTVNTIKELTDWVATHGPEAAEMAAGIQANEAAIAENKAAIEANDGEIADLKALVGTTSVDAQIEAALTDVKTDVEENAQGVAENKAAIETLNGTGDGSVSKTVSDALDAALKVDGADKYALAADLDAAEKTIEEHTASLTAATEKLATIEEGAQVNKIEKIQLNGVDQEIVDKVVNLVLGALAAKDKVAEADLDAELAGVIAAKAEAAEISAVGYSGNINDLEQTEGDTLILACGGAAG